MHLVSLDSDKAGFKRVKFNDKGLTLIVGKQKNPNDNDNSKTYNGVGKSLIVFLLHFCLGSNHSRALESSLPNWTFYLVIFSGGREYIISRNTSNQKKVTLDNDEISLNKFREIIFYMVSSESLDRNNISFRALIKRFIRPNKAGYSSFDTPDSKEFDYQKQLYKCMLLGFDLDQAEKKKVLKTKLDIAVNNKKMLEKDSIFKEYFTGGKDPTIRLSELRDEIASKKKNLNDFKIAENYNEIRKKANLILSEINILRNKIYSIKNNISNIDKSLLEHPDIQRERVLKIYSQANIIIKDDGLRHIDEVYNFHNRLLENRRARLSKDRNDLLKQLSIQERSSQEKNSSYNGLMKFLDGKGALEEYNEMANYLNELIGREQRIKDYLKLISDVNKTAHILAIDLLHCDISASEYLESEITKIERNSSIFRDIGKRFYPDKPLGLSVKINNGENQTQFNIDAKIESDTSDGINEVKIFTYDLTTLVLQQSHCIGMIFHDSRLFSNIDPRQRSMIFKTAHEYTLKHGMQYIATVNQEQIEDESFKRWFSDTEYTSIITDSTVLELTDDSDAGKLLGIQVDLDYEA